MSLATLSGTNHEMLLEHLESMFTLAQVISRDAEHAAQLVDVTYRRASQAAPDFPSRESARIWLFQLMMKVREESDETLHVDAVSADPPYDLSQDPATGTSGRSPDLADLRRRLVDEFIDHAVPRAFSTLPTHQRAILMLCDVESIPCEEAGSILGLDPALACSRLDDARYALHRLVARSATHVEGVLLETSTVENWQQAALQRMANTQFVTTPPTLRPSIASIFKTESGSAAAEATSHERVSPKAVSTTWRSFSKKIGIVVVTVAVAGLLGYGFTYLMNREPDLNLITLSARQAESIVVTFQTTSPEQAERYLFDRLGTRITIPLINDADLQGVSIREVVENADVPILLFEDASSNRSITIYVYTYAFLDRHENRLILEGDVLRQIEDEGNFDLHDLGDTKALIWRYRDDIFVAITEGDAEELRGRIIPPA